MTEPVEDASLAGLFVHFPRDGVRVQAKLRGVATWPAGTYARLECFNITGQWKPLACDLHVRVDSLIANTGEPLVEWLEGP